MNTQIKQNQDNCEICYSIKCKSCGWEPDAVELPKVFSGELSNCPDCGGAK